MPGQTSPERPLSSLFAPFAHPSLSVPALPHSSRQDRAALERFSSLDASPDPAQQLLQ